MAINNTKTFWVEEAMIESWNSMRSKPLLEWEKEELLDNLAPHLRRASILAKDKRKWHDTFLAWAVVKADFEMTNKWRIEAERYHWFQIVSSLSTMHRLSEMEMDKCFYEYVDKNIIQRMKELQDEYKANPTRENKLKMLYSCPAWLKLQATICTNYLQLKNMVRQRRQHQLPEWKEFEERASQLPYAKELIFTWSTPFEHPFDIEEDFDNLFNNYNKWVEQNNKEKI